MADSLAKAQPMTSRLAKAQLPPTENLKPIKPECRHILSGVPTPRRCPPGELYVNSDNYQVKPTNIYQEPFNK